MKRTKVNQCHPLAAPRQAAEVANFNETVPKYVHLIQLTIDRLGGLDFYQQRLGMVDSRVEGRQSEGLKRFESALTLDGW